MKIRDISIRLAGVLLGTALAASGCGGGETHEFHNTGRACLFPGATPITDPFLFVVPEPAPQYFGPDGVATVAVFLRCMSSTCTVEGSASASCTVERIGGELRVEARGSYRDTGANACSTDCRPLTAQCVTAPIPEGMVAFEYAGESTVLVVPSTVPPPCVESSP